MGKNKIKIRKKYFYPEKKQYIYPNIYPKKAIFNILSFQKLRSLQQHINLQKEVLFLKT